MRLAAVVSLVVEEMQQQRRQQLLDLRGAPRAAIADRARELPFRKPGDIFVDARVLGAAARAQLREILVKDRVELLGLLALAGEAMHPDAVAQQQMIERAVERAEERAAVAPILGVGNARRGIIEPLVDPRDVGREHREERFHGSPPGSPPHSMSIQRREGAHDAESAMHGTRNCLAALLVLLATGAGIAETLPHWSAGAPMPSARAEIAVAELGGKVYVVGAFTGERELEIYDAAANRWSRGAPLPHSVHHPAAVAVNGKIYAIGGYVSGWTATADVLEYDPAADRWRAVAPLPTARGEIGRASRRGRRESLVGGG